MQSALLFLRTNPSLSVSKKAMVKGGGGGVGGNTNTTRTLAE
jgi:hypothetical protein